MAKEKITIDTSGAVRSLDKLQKSVEKYNTTVRDGVKATKDQNTASGKAATTLQRLTDTLKAANNALKPAATRFSAIGGSLTSMATSSRSAARSMSSLSTSAATFATNFSSVNSSVNTFRRELNLASNALLKDTKLTQASTLVMREFNTQMIRAVDIMREKNKKLQAQSNYVKQDTDSVNKSRTSVLGLVDGWRRYVRLAKDVIFATTIHRGILRTVQALLRSIEEAREFSIKVGEIRTIQGQAKLSTDQWEQSLINLGKSYGIDVLEAAEAAYQALSNQVTDATNTTRFLRTEIQLAVATVSTLETAVSATTSVLNAYGFSVNRSASVNAVLFKTVELGRTRLDEFADSLGNVSILSSQLNIRLVEQQAALTLLTRQGVRMDAAMTLLRNVELRLIKPTEEMSNLFREWGVTSGANAVATFGLVGVLQRLWEAAGRGGDAMSDLGDVLGQLRSIVGFLGLRTADYRNELQKFETSGRETWVAYQTVVETTGKRVERELNKAKAFFIETFGRTVNETLVFIIDQFKSLPNALALLRQSITDLSVALTIAIVSFKTMTAASASLNVQLALNLTLMGKINLLLTTISSAAAAIFTRLNIAIAIFSGGVYALYRGLTENRRALGEIERKGALAREELDKLSDVNFQRLNGELTDAATRFENATEETFRFFNTIIAGVRASVNSLDTNFKKAFERVGDSIKKGMADPLKTVEAQLDSLRSEIERLRSEAERFSKSASDRRLDTELTGKREAIDIAAITAADPEKERIRGLFKLRNELFNRALEAQRKGDTELTDTLFGHVEDLHREITENIRKQVTDASRGTTASLKRTTPFINPITGRVTTRTTTTKVEVPPDAAVLKKLSDDLLTLEKQRAFVVETRIKAEEAFAARDLARARTKETELKTREDAFGRLSTLLAQIDAFESKGPASVSTYKKLLAETAKAATDAGLDPAARLDLLRKAKEQELILERQAAVQAANERLRIATENINAIQQRLQAATKERQEANADLISNVTQRIAPELGQSIAELQVFLDKLVTKGPFTKIINRQAIENLKTELKTLADELGSPDLTGQGLDQLQNKFITLIKDLQVLNTEELRFRNSIKNIKVAKDDTYFVTASKSIGDIVKQLIEFDQVIEQSQQRINKNLTEEGSLNATLKQVQETINSLPEEWRKSAQATIEHTNNVEKAQRSLNDQLRETINLLRSIPPQATQNVGGGALFGRAHGGSIGVDQYHALLRDGEIVSTRSASQRYAPLIHAMNASSQESRPRQNGNITFGDINISVPQGSSDMQIDTVIRGLQRRIRQGALNI